MNKLLYFYRSIERIISDELKLFKGWMRDVSKYNVYNSGYILSNSEIVFLCP